MSISLICVGLGNWGISLICVGLGNWGISLICVGLGNWGISLILGHKSLYFSLISMENEKIILLYIMYISLDLLKSP
jgi:hypothetical protein